MRLPYDAILNRSEMLEVMTSDARLAHVSDSALSGVLDAIYSGEGREDLDRAECAHTAFYGAWVQGKLPDQLFCARDTIDQAARDLNAVCCVCGHVSYNWEHRLPVELQVHLAPSVTVFEYVEDGEKETIICGPTVLCKYCSTPFVRRSRRGGYYSGHGTVWNDALAELSTDRNAKKRIEQNARIWARLRFDPRLSTSEYINWRAA